MYKSKIKTFYNHKQIVETNIELSHSKSPLKPKLLLKYLKRHKIQEEYLEIEHFKVFSQKDFLTNFENYCTPLLHTSQIYKSKKASHFHERLDFAVYPRRDLNPYVREDTGF
jgi:hypothetical protein